MKTHVFKILSACALLATTILSAAERPTLESLLGQAQRQIETASHHAKLEELEPARLAIDKALVLDAKSPWAWYYKGYAAYTEAVLQMVKHDSVARETALNEADRALQKSVELQDNGEARALRTFVLGALMQVRGPQSGEQIGPEIAQNLAASQQLAPKSPRVLMIAAVSSLYTPPEWGGDVRRAAKLIEEASAQMEQEKAVAPQPSWGRAEIYAWTGVIQQKLGDAAKAKAAFERALALDPDYAWVKYVLIPSLAAPAHP